ncbi:MAG: phosphomethylpyrimidine synthase ThiC, partial [Verrucomicrobia bacterium]|nr:phosphomethylpyrimidine synthase ThiC [Verrucomicrobiota bacterium]
MTQLQRANAGEVTPQIEQVAAIEYRTPEEIRLHVAEGKIVIPANIHHKNLKPMGIGRLLRTKINANIGNSALSSCPMQELEKLNNAVKYGADTVMDLSTGENIIQIRQKIIENSPVPVGTVPIYEALARAGGSQGLSESLILQVIREQAEQGVDYMTVHSGILLKHIDFAKKRLLRIVSRGGSILARWMRQNQQENPFYTAFDEILKICLEHDVTLSLGDGMRPGCLADASDAAQFAELETLGELVRRCRKAGVQAMVEGPGHIPFDQIEMNMRREREVCDDAPFYILGPVVTDCAPGYDHITSAIGA